MAAVAAQPVFRLLGAKGLGVSDDYMKEKMPPVNVGLLDGQGKVHWATSAKASSTYADAPARTRAFWRTDKMAGDAVVLDTAIAGQAVKQGDILLTLSDTQPKFCFVIVQGENGEGHIVRYTLSGKERMLEVLAKAVDEIVEASGLSDIARAGGLASPPQEIEVDLGGFIKSLIRPRDHPEELPPRGQVVKRVRFI